MLVFSMEQADISNKTGCYPFPFVPSCPDSRHFPYQLSGYNVFTKRRHSVLGGYIVFHHKESSCNHFANQAKIVFCHKMRLL